MIDNQSNNSEKTKSLKDIILDYIKQEISDLVNFHTQSEDENSWNLNEIYEVIDTIFPVPLEVRVKLEEIKEHKSTESTKAQKAPDNSQQKIIDYLFHLAVKEYEKLEERINGNENLKSQIKDEKIKPMNLIEKMVLLRSIDMLWVEHIDAMDHMRTGIGLRSYGQKDPLVEYKKEAHRMFQELILNIRKQVVYSIYKVGISPVNYQRTVINDQKSGMSFSGPAKRGSISSTVIPFKGGKKKVGRNDPCPCGSGKKYKKCHGK